MFGLFRSLRRLRLRRRQFPSEWIKHLQANVPFYRRLPEELKPEFHDLLKIFVWEKYFTGVKGMEITDEVRVVISAVAVRLILHLDLSYYDHVSEVIVYPYIYKHENTDGAILGEANTLGTVVLSWPAVIEGLKDQRDGEDVTMHEFAHVLDVSDGCFDGTPPFQAREDYRPWVTTLSDHFEKLRKRGRSQRKVLRRYGATNPAEFMAVATESFFEKPKQMKKHTPDLYEELKAFYGFDPASDDLEGVPSGDKIGRNDRCPCGSGRKYKRCCGR